MGAVRCLACGKVLISRSRHDYVTCGCPQSTMVDGGDDYQRTGGKEMSKVQVLHPILLTPRTKDGDDVSSIPDGNILLKVVDNASKLISMFPEFADPDGPCPPAYLLEREEESLTNFTDEAKRTVIGLKKGLVELREARYTALTAVSPAPVTPVEESKPNEKKPSRRSTKASAKKEQPGTPP